MFVERSAVLSEDADLLGLLIALQKLFLKISRQLQKCLIHGSLSGNESKGTAGAERDS